MLEELADKATRCLIGKGSIGETQFPIYKYGLELLISSFFETILICTLGTILFSFSETITFIVCFILTRSFCGGYHAKTYLKCSFFTLLTFLIVLSLAHTCFLDINGLLLFATVDLLVIIFFAPVENKAKPIDEEQKKRLKIVSAFIYLAFITICFILYFFKIKDSAYTVVYSISSAVVLLLVEKTKNLLHKKGE